MNRLALGTVQFGLNYGIANQDGQVSYQEARSILHDAKSAGITTLDTAIAYGESEERLGHIGIQDWQVITKLPDVALGCGDILKWVNDAICESLNRLKIQALYGILLHRSDQLQGGQGDLLYAALQQLKRDGMVKKIGVSIYDPSELDALCPRFHFDLVQAPFNLLDHRLINSGWMSRLQVQKTELHVRSVFLQGLLLMDSVSRPQKFDRWSALWAGVTQWQAQTGLTPMQACIRHALSAPEISKVIVGVNTRLQLSEILRDSTGPIPEIPAELQTDDMDLLNPSKWRTL